jgi:two-component system sensor histidine kinase HydH
VLIALILGAALVASSALSYRDARLASGVVAEGQGIRFLRKLEATLGHESPRPGALQAALEANRSLGLTYVAELEHGSPVRQAGQALLADTTAVAGTPAFGRGRVRMVSPGPGPHPPPPGDDHPPPPPGDDGWPPPPHHGPPHHRQLVIEFDPISSEDAVRRALMVLWLSSGAAGLLALAALVLGARARRAERVEEQFSAQRHLAQLGAMSAVLAHEIRNPLAALKGHAQLLAERVRGDALAPRVDRVVQEAVRLEELTNGLLEFVRSGGIALAPTDPSAPLARAVRLTGPDRIDCRADGAPPHFSLDAARIEQVLINLLENALAVTPPHERVLATVTADREGLRYVVRDHGPGVPAAERSRIFEPFHTTKTRGTGLGLAVSRRIVELHGGHIDVGDAPDGGAVFEVHLPPGERAVS